MEGWTHGYVADIDYVFGFYPELAPRLLSLAMLSKGVRPPPLRGPFTYCELGFGQGFSINLLAAANPNGDFWGTDFNPAHAAGAERLAMTVGSKNIHLFDKSFAEFVDLDTPPFDFIALHGIYSWISADNRRAIVEILRKKLKFGGVVYISYNALPGWSAAMPLRELMIGSGAGAAEGTVKRVERALSFAQRVADLNAGYFSGNPGVVQRLALMVAQNRNYLAHEYFNRDWNPQYHAEVAAELAQAKLVFAASAHMPDHIDKLNLSDDAQKLLAELSDSTFRETVRDYFVNQQFRRDIFVKGLQKITPQEQAEVFNETPFILTVPRAELNLKVNLGFGQGTLQPEIYHPIADGLAEGAATVKELALKHERVRALNPARVVEALVVLVATGQAAATLGAEGRTERDEHCRRFNDHVLNQARFADELHALASPVTGSGVLSQRFERLFFLARRSDAGDPGEFAWKILEAQGQRLRKDGKVLEAPADNVRELRRQAEVFEGTRLPVWEKLGLG